jgi:hypothetical protein
MREMITNFYLIHVQNWKVLFFFSDKILKSLPSIYRHNTERGLTMVFVSRPNKVWRDFTNG